MEHDGDARLSLPWFKFNPGSWRGDQALRAVSLAARGLWIDCLCIMHEAKPYGHLVLNGSAIDDETLARMTGVPVDEVRANMAELRKAGVLSVTAKGVVFSRRMTKDYAASQKGRKSANKRWAQDAELEQQFDRPNGYPSGEPNAQEMSEVSQKLEQAPLKPPKGGDRRRGKPKGAEVFRSRAQEIRDEPAGSSESVGGNRLDAGRVPILAIEHH